MLCGELSLPDTMHRTLLLRLQLLHRFVSQFTNPLISLQSNQVNISKPASFCFNEFLLFPSNLINTCVISWCRNSIECADSSWFCLLFSSWKKKQLLNIGGLYPDQTSIFRNIPLSKSYNKSYLSEKVLLQVMILDQPPSTELSYLIVQPIFLPPENRICGHKNLR